MVLKVLQQFERSGLRGIYLSLLFAFQPSISVNCITKCTNSTTAELKRTNIHIKSQAEKATKSKTVSWFQIDLT